MDVDPAVIQIQDIQNGVFRSCTNLISVKVTNECTACSFLFLSTTGLLSVPRKILEHEIQSIARKFF